MCQAKFLQFIPVILTDLLSIPVHLEQPHFSNKVFFLFAKKCLFAKKGPNQEQTILKYIEF